MYPRLHAIFATGFTLYAVIRNASDQVWNGTSFVTYNAVNWGTYAVTVTEQGATGLYVAALPTGITAEGIYLVEYQRRIGGSPAVSDPTVFETEFGVGRGYAATDANNRPLPYGLHYGTAQAGASNTITLAAAAPTTNFAKSLVVITAGTGAGQCAYIAFYNNSTKVATVDPPWNVVPNNTSAYTILAASEMERLAGPIGYDRYGSMVLSYDFNQAPWLDRRTITDVINSGTRLVIDSGGDENLLTLKGAVIVQHNEDAPAGSGTGMSIAEVVGASNGVDGSSFVDISPAGAISPGPVRFYPGVAASGGGGGFTGDGDTLVNHNTGGTDTLRVLDPSNVAVDNAELLAYRKADYDAGIYTLRDRSITRSDGRWARPMSLNPAIVYTILIRKTGVIAPATVEVTPA